MLSIFGTKDQFLGVIRHFVTFMAGIIVAKGNLDPSALDTIVGIAVGVAGLIWSIMSPEKTTPITAEKVISSMEPNKLAAVEKILAKTEEATPAPKTPPPLKP